MCPVGATGVDRVQASQHYAKRTGYTFEAVKTTLLVDWETSAFLDIRCSTKQPHDTQVGWQVLVRNLDASSAVAADKGYDWEALRSKLRAEGITPLVPTRVMDLRGHVRNLLLDDRTYHQRSNAEWVFFGSRRRYGETSWSRAYRYCPEDGGSTRRMEKPKLEAVARAFPSIPTLVA